MPKWVPKSPLITDFGWKKGTLENKNLNQSQTIGPRDVQNGLKWPSWILIYDWSCSPKFFPNIQGSLAFKFRFGPEMVSQNVVEKIKLLVKFKQLGLETSNMA